MPIRRRLLPWLLAALAVGALAPAAGAHTGGKAEPLIAAKLSGQTPFLRIVTVRLTDVDDPDAPIAGATVTVVASMTAPDHRMSTRPAALAEVRPGLYRGRLRFLMGGTDWTVRIRVGGDEVVPASAKLVTFVDPEGLTPAAPAPPPPAESASPASPPDPAAPGPAEAPPAPSAGPTAAPAPAPPSAEPEAAPLAAADAADAEAEAAAEVDVLPTRLDAVVTGRDTLRIVLLWLHGLAAAGWLLGVVVTAVALSLVPGVLQPGVRPTLARWYRRRGVWLHWALALVVVATGIYNVYEVTPFDLSWSPDAPYGSLYVALLAAKLAGFALLLVTATLLTRRVLRRAAPAVTGRPLRQLAASLGPAGIAYLALVPLVLGLVVALRYVHVLSHVAAVVDAGGG